MQKQKLDCQKEVIEILKVLMDKVKKEWSSNGNPFADTQILTDKVMTYEHNSDESKGWTGTRSNISEKPKDSNVVLLVTYDGVGYYYFSYCADFGSGMLTDKLQEELKKRFGDRFNIEHCNNWAFEVYDNEDLEC